MRIAVSIIAGILSQATFAAAPIDGPYSQLFGGYAYVPNNIEVTKWGLTRANSNQLAGFDAGGNLGFKSNLMRYEGEFTYIKANSNKFTINNIAQTGVSGYNQVLLGLANVYYDWPTLSTTLQPFLGAGIGYAWVQAKLDSSGPFGMTNFNASNSVFAYQATGGLTYNFADNYAFSLGYRYIATPNATELGHSVQAHLANLGAIYRFDGRSYQ